MELCFATNNAHKLQEVANYLGGVFILRTLTEIGCLDELPETTGTIPGNSRQKAEYVWHHYGVACFADDSGLEVEALQGAPGVDSAIYAGLPRSHERNSALLLANLEGIINRQARFRSVFTLVLDGLEQQFEGTTEGTILTSPRGEGGFGYDPLFVPDGYTRTFAEMTLDEKNVISHRGRALAKLIQYLQGQVM